MLKKLKDTIHNQLLKVNWIQREVKAYKREQEIQKTEQAEREHHEHWARLMHSGCKVRNIRPEKLDVSDTLKVVTDDGLYVDYLGGKVVGQGYVEPLYVDSTNWGVK